MITKIQDNISKHFRIRGLTLYLVQAPLWIALPVHALNGRVSAAFCDLLLLVSILYAAKLTKDYFRTPFPPVDHRPIAAVCLALALTIFFIGTLRRPPTLSILMGILAGVGYCLVYFGKNSSSPVIESPKISPPPLKIKPRESQPTSVPVYSPPEHLPPTLKGMLIEGHNAIEALNQNAMKLIELRNEKRLGQKLNKITQQAREIIKQIEQYPDRIRAARAFLVIHLIELRNISNNYLLDIDRPNHDNQRKNFYHLLCESEQAFTAQHLELTHLEQEQLDIQIQVLRDQLKQGNSHD